MTATRWIVRRSGYPFSLPGKVIGVVESSDAALARLMAKQRFGSDVVVEPEHRVNPQLERAVDRAVKAAGRRERAGAYGRSRRGAKPLTIPDGDAA